MTKLIINADDFGYSEIFNIKILEFLKNGLVTSTSVMVNSITKAQTNQVQALIKFYNENPGSVGLHIDFNSTHFEKEIKKQYKLFLDIFNKKPAHINIHTYKFVKKGYPIVMDFCSKHNIPCRNHGLQGTNITTTSDAFDTMNCSFDEISIWLKSLDNKIYEIVFHPGDYDPNSKSSYNKKRENDSKYLIKLQPLIKLLNIKSIKFDALNN